MVARTPPKLKKKPVAPLDPNQLRETVIKVEKCMDRLLELQYITGGTKVISGVNLSPRSTRGYLKTSLSCKQESLRIKNLNGQKSPSGKFPAHKIGEWQRMSLPAMILGETVGEILQASQFAREIVAVAGSKPKKISIGGDPKTPVTESRWNSRLVPETTELRSRRKREKQIIRSDPYSPQLQRAKSRINFKVSGSPPKKDIEQEKCRYPANRVSPKNRPWARKTVIFPNPLFHSTPNSQNQQFCRTKSPVISRTQPTTPHKFLIKTPPAVSGKTGASSSSVAKFQVKIRSPTITVSPTAKKKVVSPPKKVSTAAKLRRSLSPSRLVSRLASPLKNRLASPLKGRKSFVQKSMDGSEMLNMMSGLKQRPAAVAISRTTVRASLQ